MADRTYFGGPEDRTVAVSKNTPLPVQLYGANAASPFVTIFGEQQVISQRPDVLVQFQYNLSSYDVSSVLSGTGSVAQAASQGEAHTGTGVGLARLSSHEIVRYRPGHEGYVEMTARFTTPEANTTQLAGLLDADHGFAYGFNGTELACTLRNSGTDNFDLATVLDPLDGTGPSQFKLVPTNLNLYKITFGWLGIAPIVFWIHTGYVGGWIPFGYIDLVNKQVAVSIANPFLAVALEVERTSGTGADLVAASGSWNGGTCSTDTAHFVGARTFGYDGGKTIPAGVLTNLFTFKSATTFQSVESHIRSELLLLSGSLDGTKPGDILIYKGATLGGTPVYNDIDATNSVISVDVAGTTVSGGTFVTALELSKTGNDHLDLSKLNVHIHPGGTLTLAALSVNATDAAANVRWNDLF